MDPVKQFQQEKADFISKMRQDEELKKKSLDWMLHADKYKYIYNFTWLGIPIIKFPQDIQALQEVIWKVKPDLIIETGIAHGGSIIFSASMMHLLGNNGKVLAVDIDIRDHNRTLIESSPFYKYITMIQGSSTDQYIINQIKHFAKDYKNIMVCLDSNHTHEHVLRELELYAPLVSNESYIILPDTLIEFYPEGYYDNRPWDVGDNPHTAMLEFLKHNPDFEADNEITDKLLITEAYGGGFLKRLKS
ncbi:MAG: cephalosporin hydroxylase family protein [Saprospiraceae bacterium]|nr:cephalosporin hydroxylase family protein [Saprospiraceae bacterium]